MKLCMIQASQLPEEFRDMAFGILKPSFEKVLRPDTKVILKGLKSGLMGDNYLDFDNPYFSLLNKRGIVEAVIEAEKEGFDAAWVNCFGDPGVAEARHAVNMPVFGPAESSMLFACQLGRKFAIITANMPNQVPQVEEQVRLHRLEGRLIPNGVRLDKDPFPEAFPRYIQDPKVAAESTEAVARECVADGADVIIIGCCGTGPLCSMAGFNKITVRGQDVPILDPVMVVAKTAEMAVDIRKGVGLPIPSRVGGRAIPSKEDMARVRSAFGLPA
ncbi:MAG: hypothetical protein FJ012_09200 [Chloroflexi bacterium]|nr:hypothetical protein [Chloroflexota bacterium]